jgi:protease-4
MAENGGNLEREVLEKLALAAVIEQRRSRRWGIFFKLLTFAYLTLLLMIAMEWRVGGESLAGGRHTALVDIVGVIEAKGDASADRVILALQEYARRGPSHQFSGRQPRAGRDHLR